MDIRSDHNPGTLIFRCDASVTMGTGHVMRCLALAQAWQDSRGEAIFAMSQPGMAIEGLIRAEKMATIRVPSLAGSVQDAEELIRAAKDYSTRWVVVDGYGFDVNYQRALKNAGLKLLLVDDGTHAAHYFADVVLNQNAGAHEELYPNREPYTQLLLGLRFALLRREFTTAASEGKREIAPAAKKLLVTMGGSDPDNLTLRVVRALASLKEFEVTTLAGLSNPYLQSLKEAASEYEGRLRIVVNSTQMRELMLWADLAVIPAGGTLWELLCLGTPVLSYARNSLQAGILSKLEAQGALHFLGNVEAFDGASLTATVRDLGSAFQKRSHMSQLGRNLIDGQGTMRICDVLLGKGAA